MGRAAPQRALPAAFLRVLAGGRGAEFLYISRRHDSLLSLLFDVSKSVLICLIITGFIVAFYTLRGAEPIFLSYFGLLVLSLLSIFRMALQIILRSLRSHGRNERQMLIVGVNERTQELVEVIAGHRYYGYRIAGMLEDEPERGRRLEKYNIAYLGKFDALEEVLVKQVIDEVYSACRCVRAMKPFSAWHTFAKASAWACG